MVEQHQKVLGELLDWHINRNNTIITNSLKRNYALRELLRTLRFKQITYNIK